MKQSDLKPGQICKFERGTFGIVFGTSIVTFTDKSGGGVAAHMIDDRGIQYGQHAIIAVYQVKPSATLQANFEYWFLGSSTHPNILDECDLIWEYNPIEELTLAQVCNELGREVKIIK